MGVWVLALLAVVRGRAEIDIVLQLDPDRHVGVASWVGVEVPLHASAAGKLALAELTQAELDGWLAEHPLEAFTPATVTDAAALVRQLERVRRRGAAELVDELEDGHASLAVAVRSGGGGLVGALGISRPDVPAPPAAAPRPGARLQAAAAAELSV